MKRKSLWMIEILNDNHYATFYMPCNADDLDENKP